MCPSKTKHFHLYWEISNIFTGQAQFNGLGLRTNVFWVDCYNYIPPSFLAGLVGFCSGFFVSGFLAAWPALAAAGPGSFFAYKKHKHVKQWSQNIRVQNFTCPIALASLGAEQVEILKPVVYFCFYHTKWSAGHGEI